MSQAYQSNVSPQEAVGAARASQMVKLSANENPFGASPRALAAVRNALPELWLYPDGVDTRLKMALARLHGLNAEHFVTANGGCDVLRLVASAYLQKDSSIVVCRPTFPIYERTAKQFGAEIIDAPLNADFAPQPEMLRAAIKANTKVVYLCNPNNPTGTTFGQDTFDALLSAIPENVLIVYDEVYHHFVTDMELPDAKAALRAGRNLLIVHSFSKAYGLAGLRMGYGIARVDVVARLESQANPFPSSILALAAAEAALSDDEHVRRTVQNNTRERASLSKNLTDMGLRVWDAQANFVLFEVPLPHTPQDIVTALQSQNVLIRPAYGLDNHLRVSVGLPEGNAEFIAALQKILR